MQSPAEIKAAKKAEAAAARLRLAFEPAAKSARSKIVARDSSSPNMFCRPVGAARGQIVAPVMAADARRSGLTRRKGRTLLRAIRPNAGTEAIYRRRILDLVDGMAAETMRLIKRTYQMTPPVAAQDAVDTPADVFQLAMNEIAKRWQLQFDHAAPMLAEYFSTAVWMRTDAQLKAALKAGGFSVEFHITPAMKDILQATVEQNVGLIKSIPQKYLTEVQGMVMRSVQTGRDAGQLYSDIREQFGVTRRRAALIARDQNNKATSALQEARRKEAGLTQAVWMHSGGGKHPRPKHVKATGTVYEVGVGLPIGDKGQYVLPGEEINCRCVSRAVIPGF